MFRGTLSVAILLAQESKMLLNISVFTSLRLGVSYLYSINSMLIWREMRNGDLYNILQCRQEVSKLLIVTVIIRVAQYP